MFPQIFGKYVLERPLAAGGMASVFLATLRGAVGFEKKLVVKQIRAELATDEAFVRRFVAEAKTTVELSHPNIVPVYELGVEHGIYYLAMELCDGVTLAELLETRGKLSAEEGAYVGIEICRALDYAHRKARVIHRDVTPRNVVIDEEGAVRLIDFGIAAPAFEGNEEVFGSPGHMPPEQLHGREIGPPTDVFAVAALLYEAWCGKPAFRRNTAERSQAALYEPVPPPSTFSPELGAVDALVAGALSLDPAARPPSAEDLSRPLRRFIADRDLGDVARKVGARVRDVRASRSAAIARLPEPLAAATPTANETRTFATRSHDVNGGDSLPSPRGTAPRDAFGPTRRVSDDASSWSTGRSSASRSTTGRSIAAKYRRIGGTAAALALVGGIAALAWRQRAGATPAAPRDEPTASAGAAPNEDTEPLSAAALPARGEATTNGAPPAMPASSGESRATSVGSGPHAHGSATHASGAPARATAGSSTPPSTGKSDTGSGHLRILADPMANVEIDGRPRGTAPIAGLALAPGTHFVRLDCTALGEAVAQNVPIAAGESVTISGDFTGAHGRISIRRGRATP